MALPPASGRPRDPRIYPAHGRHDAFFPHIGFFVFSWAGGIKSALRVFL
jgi:hypothetical protein